MNPLDQLLPPISPPPVSWWPPAPGWWLLLILLPLLFWGLWQLRKRLAGKLRKPKRSNELDPLRLAALHELEQLPRPLPDEPAGIWLQQLNALLKRLCRDRLWLGVSHLLSNNEVRRYLGLQAMARRTGAVTAAASS